MTHAEDGSRGRGIEPFVAPSSNPYSLPLLCGRALERLDYPVAIVSVTTYDSLPPYYKEDILQGNLRGEVERDRQRAQAEIDEGSWAVVSMPPDLENFFDTDVLEDDLIERPMNRLILEAIQRVDWGTALYDSTYAIPPYVEESGDPEVLQLFQRLFITTFQREYPRINKVLAGEGSLLWPYSDTYLINFTLVEPLYKKLVETLTPMSPDEIVDLLVRIFMDAESDHPEIARHKVGKIPDDLSELE